MKKIISTLLVCVLLLGCVLTLASCGKKLRGTYVMEIGGVELASYTFKGKKVTVKSGSVTTEGTYKIKGDKITITMEVEGEEFEEEYDFEKGKDYIKIDGVELKKK